MTRDEEAPDPSLFDRRIVERNIKRGLITRKDYERFLKSQPDASGKVRSPDEAPDANSGSAGPGTPSPAAHG
ncbi:MAG TPA: hypothetical protein VJ801_16205 [Polyangia bacterium]|jgi:hypothetical protein|nr:hypothetical protein [Polyangia bacterium]